MYWQLEVVLARDAHLNAFLNVYHLYGNRHIAWNVWKYDLPIVDQFSTWVNFSRVGGSLK